MTVTSIDITGANGVSSAGGPITSSGSITVGLGDITPNSVTIQQSAGNAGLTFTNDSFITGDFSSSALTRTFIKTSTANARTLLAVTANGTPTAGNYTGLQAFGNQSNTNFSQITMGISETDGIAVLNSSNAGTGTLLPLHLTTGPAGSTGIIIDTSHNTAIKNNLTVSGTSQFNNTVYVGSSTFPSNLVITGGTTSAAELQLQNSSNGAIISMDAGNTTYPASIMLANPSTGTSIELVAATTSASSHLDISNINSSNLDIQMIGSDGVNAGSISANGLNLNGGIIIKGTTTTSGNSTADILANSATGTNDVSIRISPLNNGNISVTNLHMVTKVTSDANVSGNATLVAGSVTVSTSAVTASSVILLSVGTLGTVTSPKAVHWSNRIAGTSFVITSSDATDTSTVSWMIIG